MSTAAKENFQFIDGDMEIIAIFKSLLNSKEKIWVWQKTPGRSGKRPVHFAIVRKVDPIRKTVEIRPTNSMGFKFDTNEDIFIYSSSRSVACKVSLREKTAQMINFLVPKRMSIMDGDVVKSLALVEKEEEGKNKHKRQLPRVVAKKDQMVSIHRAINNTHSIYLLYDMSSAGMGFKIDDPAEFEIGEKVEVIGIDGKPFGKKIFGRVVAIRQMEDDSKIFKVGVKFDP